MCIQSKAQSKQCRRIKKTNEEEEQLARPKKIGDIVTADHIIVGDEDVAGRGKQRVSLAVLDRGTGWIRSYPAKQHTANETFIALQDFAGPREPVKLLYTDGAPEYKEAAEKLGWIHQRSTPYRPQTNGVAERNVQRIVQGTRAVLQQSGMDHCWWPEASECYCFLHNVADALRDEKTPHELRHGHNFLGMKIPFGSLISFKPSGPSAKNLPKFAPRTVEGLFMGYHLHAGVNGVEITMSFQKHPTRKRMLSATSIRNV